MTTVKEQTRMNHMLNSIKQAGTIHKFDLQDLVGMSVFSYNQISAKFIRRYEEQLHQIEYNTKTKTFKWCEILEVSNPVEEAGK